MPVRRLLAYAAIYFLWGATYLAVRTVVLVTPPFAAAGLRFLLSGLLLLALSWRPGAQWPTRAEWVDSTKLGFVMFGINYACFFWSEQRLYSGIAAVVVSTMPVWILAAEWLAGYLRQLPSATLVGCLLGIGGVALVTGTGAAAGASSKGVTEIATLVLLTGTLAWSGGSVWSRSLRLPNRQAVRSALQMGTGGVFLLILAAATGESHATIAAIQTWSLWVTLCFVYMIAASILAFTAYTWLLHREPASRVASYAYVNPLVALGLGVGLAHEHVTVWQMLGGSMVLLGVFATLRSRPKAQQRSPKELLQPAAEA
jgi:drug/metabolite transporter (DMT)-like permease